MHPPSSIFSTRGKFCPFILSRVHYELLIQWSIAVGDLPFMCSWPWWCASFLVSRGPTVTSCVLINANNNISTTIMTVLFVPFCPAQDGESTDMNCLVFWEDLQEITKFNTPSIIRGFLPVVAIFVHKYLNNCTCYNKIAYIILFSSRWWVYWYKLFSVLSTLRKWQNFHKTPSL